MVPLAVLATNSLSLSGDSANGRTWPLSNVRRAPGTGLSIGASPGKRPSGAPGASGVPPSWAPLPPHRSDERGESEDGESLAWHVRAFYTNSEGMYSRRHALDVGALRRAVAGDSPAGSRSPHVGENPPYDPRADRARPRGPARPRSAAARSSRSGRRARLRAGAGAGARDVPRATGAQPFVVAGQRHAGDGDGGRQPHRSRRAGRGREQWLLQRPHAQHPRAARRPCRRGAGSAGRVSRSGGHRRGTVGLGRQAGGRDPRRHLDRRCAPRSPTWRGWRASAAPLSSSTACARSAARSSARTPGAVDVCLTASQEGARRPPGAGGGRRGTAGPGGATRQEVAGAVAVSRLHRVAADHGSLRARPGAVLRDAAGETSCSRSRSACGSSWPRASRPASPGNARIGAACRAAWAALGPTSILPARAALAANTLSAVYYPQGVDARAGRAGARRGCCHRRGASTPRRGRAISASATMGALKAGDALVAIGAVERALAASGYRFTLARASPLRRLSSPRIELSAVSFGAFESTQRALARRRRAPRKCRSRSSLELTADR